MYPPSNIRGSVYDIYPTLRIVPREVEEPGGRNCHHPICSVFMLKYSVCIGGVRNKMMVVSTRRTEGGREENSDKIGWQWW